MTDEELVLSFATKDWKPIPRVARSIPFGYVVDENDEDILVPVPLELEALEKAKIHLKQFSYREVARWLEQVTGRYISHVGLKKRVEIERKRGTKINGLKKLADRAEKARAKAEELLSSRLGAYEQRSDGS